MGKINLRCKLLVLIFVAVIDAASTEVSHAAPWQIDIKIIGLKPVYLRGECIAARIKFKNLGDQQDQYWVDVPQGTYLVNSKGDSFGVDAIVAGWEDGHIVPGNWEGEFWPNFENGISRTCKDKTGFLPPDEYIVYSTLKYKDGSDSYRYVCSETLRFEVVEPQGKMKIIYDSYYHAWTTGHRENVKRLRQFAEKHSNTVYAPRALDQYIYDMDWSGWTKLKTAQECESLIIKYPDYPRNHWMIDRMISGYTRVGKGSEMYKKVESLRIYVKNAETNVLNEAVDEWLEILKGQYPESK
jgi:hypothetical protein